MLIDGLCLENKQELDYVSLIFYLRSLVIIKNQNMKSVKCKSGLIGSQEKLQDRYKDFSEFKNYSRVYAIHTRLGYVSMKGCWESNPTIQSSVEPSDLSRVYFHAVQTTKGFRIKESTERLCKDVKNSRVSFSTKEAVKNWIGMR